MFGLLWIRFLSYFSSPGLSFDAILKTSKVELEKIKDINVHNFIEKGMRGCISYISKRYSHCEEKKSIMYWDMNNLYGFAMIQYLL